MRLFGQGLLALAAVASLSCTAPFAANAQKSGGTLRLQHIDNPPSASIHEEGTQSVVLPFMAVYNNLVLYDQHVARNSLESIRPELATAWKWANDGKDLVFTLREGVKWHDGKPFTSEDVKCTWDQAAGLDPKSTMRKSPRQGWYANLEKISTGGAQEVTFHLKRPQPAFLALLASGWSPVYPCHVPLGQLRTKPLGTGPFKFVEFRANDMIKLARNPDYWKKGLPYLDAIEWRIMSSRSTRMLAFVAGESDVMHPNDVTLPILKDIKAQAANAQCMMFNSNVSTNLIVNRDAPPFDNPDLRRALALALDRKAFVDILTQGEAQIGGAMLPPPDGVWGMPPDQLVKVVGYGPDVKANREEARKLMQKHGYGPDKRLALKVSTRDIPQYRDPAVILIDQLKEIYIDGELEIIETSVYFNRVFQKKYVIGLNLTGSSVDDPDQHFYENYACGSLRNFTGYCNKEVQALVDQQSVETDLAKRRALVWEIDRRLQEDVARPIIMHNRGGVCVQPSVKNITYMVNSVYNGFRYEDVWLEK
jgi:peptide/nickel transport system substrate-binding protein